MKKLKQFMYFFVIAAILVSLFVIPSVAEAQSDMRLDVPFFRQIWEPWSKENLGYSNDLIENNGCALTSLAMVFKYYGIDTDPERLNNWLVQNNGYLGTSSLIWSKAAQMAGGLINYKGMINYSENANMDYINSLVDNGYPVIARMNYNGTPHFVVITGRNETKYFINDPWMENPARTINESYEPYNNPAAAIKEIVVFTTDYPTPVKIPVRKVQSNFSEGSYAIVQPIKNPQMVLQLNNVNMQVRSTTKPIDPKNNIAPMLYKDRTMLPIRAVMEEMGGKVSWDEQNQKITIDVQGRTVELWVGMRTFYINGWEFLLDAEPIISNGRTLLPLRAVMEKLGCTVSWDPAAQKILIPENR